MFSIESLNGRKAHIADQKMNWPYKVSCILFRSFSLLLMPVTLERVAILVTIVTSAIFFQSFGTSSSRVFALVPSGSILDLRSTHL